MKYCSVCDQNVHVICDLDGVIEVDCDEYEDCPFNQETYENMDGEYMEDVRLERQELSDLDDNFLDYIIENDYFDNFDYTE